MKNHITRKAELRARKLVEGIVKWALACVHPALTIDVIVLEPSLHKRIRAADPGWVSLPEPRPELPYSILACGYVFHLSASGHSYALVHDKHHNRTDVNLTKGTRDAPIVQPARKSG